MQQLSTIVPTILQVISYRDYLPLWLTGGVVVLALVLLNVWPPAWFKRHKVWLMPVGGLIIIAGLWFGVPQLKFYYDTRLSLPGYLSEQEKQQFQDRRQEIVSAPEHGKNNSGLYNDIGILRSGYKDYAGAVRAFKLAIAKNPNDPRFYRNLAITYTSMDNYGAAESAFREAFKVAPTQPEYWLELGELYSFSMKDQAQARLFYLEALERSGDNLGVVQAFALFLENVEKDFAEAIKYWQLLADKVDKNKPQFLQHIAELKLRAGVK